MNHEIQAGQEGSGKRIRRKWRGHWIESSIEDAEEGVIVGLPEQESWKDKSGKFF